MSNPHGRPEALANERYREFAAVLAGKSREEVFEFIHQNSFWGSAESVSGVGSEYAATHQLRQAIPILLRSIGARSLLDIPCGDFGWMSHVDLGGITYTGADIVEALVNQNRARYAGSPLSPTFLKLDITRDPLPPHDVVFCRDCLVHLQTADVFRAFQNLKRSGSKYLLTTTFTGLTVNVDIPTGDWRPLNFEKAPFLLPPPVDCIVEGCTEVGGAFADKSLGLWLIHLLPDGPR
jgi:hypothetical protein